MIYDAELPLSFFDNPAIQAFLRRLRSAYTSPSRFRLAITLLDDSYESVQ
jgi:hypothetical protein